MGSINGVAEIRNESAKAQVAASVSSIPASRSVPPPDLIPMAKSIISNNFVEKSPSKAPPTPKFGGVRVVEVPLDRGI
jgi:hypothetical protein